MIEAELVKSWRARGFSWQAVAMNCRRNVDDVRRDYDAGYVPQFQKPTPRDEPELRMGAALRSPPGRPDGERKLSAIAALLRSKDPVSCDAMGGMLHAASVVRDLRRKYGNDAIKHARNYGYWLTDEARKIIRHDYRGRL